MEIFKITGKLKEKKKNMENTTPPLEPVLGKTTIDIMEKVDLLDKGKFDEWIKGIKEAMSVIHKIDKSDEDILNASTKLQEILTSDQSLTFLRMLDSGLFTAVAEKIKKAKEDKFDDVIEKAEKVTENKLYKEHPKNDYIGTPPSPLTQFGSKEYSVQELYPSAQLHDIRELVPAAGVHSDYLPVN